jgi:CRISPR/Cas system Type II protein with McrA/HNH and RuvC-like nuclease domain
MCHETGVGGGSIYREREFHHTHDEALVAAQALADAQNIEVEWVVKLYDKTLSLSDYELSNAEREANKAAHSATMSKIRNFFDDFEFSDDADAMRKLVSEFREAA